MIDGTGVPLSDIIAISGGEMHSVLLKSDGTVWAMGYNGYGRLGDGTTTSRSNPVQVIESGGSVFTGVHSISAGFSHTLYLKSDGIAWSVGYNGSGQLGDGTTISRSNPVQVMDSNGSPFSNVRKLGTGSSHSIFVKGDGSAWSAGWNNMGQLGDGSTISRSNPVQVVDTGGSSLTNTISVSGGMWHSMILNSDGTMASFGRNNYGQLGDGTLINRSNLKCRFCTMPAHWLLFRRFRSRPLPPEVNTRCI